MSIDQDPAQLIDNVKRQSLRLRDALNVPLKTARLWLAKHIYQEKDIAEIQRKLKKGDMTGYLYLSSVSPGCSEEQFKQYNEDKVAITQLLSLSPVAENYDADLVLLLDKVFGV